MVFGLDPLIQTKYESIGVYIGAIVADVLGEETTAPSFILHAQMSLILP